MRILIASAIDPEAIDALSGEHDVACAFGAPEAEIREQITDREILIFRSGVSISRAVLDAAPELRLIVRAGSGLDNIDQQELRRRGIPLVRIPGPSSQAVAELTFALLLGLARDLLNADSAWREGRWIKNEIEGHLLSEKTLGVVGVGNIGGRVAELGALWGMRVVGCVAHSTEERSEALRRAGIELAPIDEVVSGSDFVSVHVPLDDSTRGLVNADFLARMKPGAFLVNTSRGGVLDEDALHEALVSGRLRGAALDVHANEGPGRLSPLRDLPNVILTPHIGASTVDTQRSIGREVLGIVAEFVAAGQGARVAAVGT